VQALRGEDITVFGDGQQSRSFCYVDDLVRAMLLMMDTPASVTGPINVGNPDEFTILELAELVCARSAGARRSATSPCLAMIRGSVSLTSPKPRHCCNGNPRLASKMGSSPPPPTSKASLPLTIQAPAP